MKPRVIPICIAVALLPLWVPSACQAKPPASVQLKGAYLFDLIDAPTQTNMSANHLTHGYAASFKRLVSEQTKRDKRFVARLTSGPSTKGTMQLVDGHQVVVHTTCQAHACNLARMAVMYRLSDGRMTGLLWDQCQLKPLGNPTEDEAQALAKLGTIPANTSQNKTQCEQER